MEQYNIMMIRDGHTERLTTARGKIARDHAVNQYGRAARKFYDSVHIYGEIAP
jgi:hypothetical protein